MALKPCKECGKEISTEAKVCPHCGKANPTSRGLVVGKGGGCLLAIIVVAVIGILSARGTDSSSSRPVPGSLRDTAVAAKARVDQIVGWTRKTCAPSAARVKKMIATHPEWENTSIAAVLCRRVGVGMTAQQVRVSLGAPEKINTTTYASGDHEQWVYGDNYIYLENGVVTAVQTSK